MIVPHYNDLRRLERCLAALEPQLTDDVVEVVVVDNGSTDPLSGLEARFPWARFVVESMKGAAAARNRGVLETRAPRLFFLDADCVPARDWLATALGLGLPTGAIGGRVDVFDETPGPRSGPEAFETVFAFHQKDYVEKKGFSVTANLLTSRTVFDAVGPLRPGLSEDLEWCRRLTAAGFPLRYRDDLVVRHPTRSDWTALERKWRRLTSEMFETRGSGARSRVLWAARAFALVPAAIVQSGAIFSEPALSWSERWRALVTLFRLRFLRAVWMIRQAATGRAGG